MPPSAGRTSGSPPPQKAPSKTDRTSLASPVSNPSMNNGSPKRSTGPDHPETTLTSTSPGKAKSTPQTNGLSASTKLRPSPARSSPIRNGISPRLRSSTIKASPNREIATPRRRLSLDSPSRQLLWEQFSRMVLDSDHEFQTKLEESTACQRQQHHDALQIAIEKHEYVRKSALTAKRRAEAEEEIERKRKEEEEIRALRQLEQRQHELDLRRAEELRQAEALQIAREQEKSRREKEHRERSEREATQRAEAEREESERRARSVREEEQRKAAQAEADRKAREAEEAAKRTSSQPAATSLLNVTQAGSIAGQSAPAVASVSTAGSSNAEHERYLQIHKELKALRRGARNQPSLKTRMGDLRREIIKSLGQLTLGKGVNKQPTEKIRDSLREALQFQTPTVDVRRFLALPPAGLTEGDAQVPMLLVYLFNIFSKSVIAQFANEAGVQVRNADPIGVLAISIFAQSEFLWQGISLIDILLAKFHKVCPVLFGVYGSEKTQKGRQRLGWAQIDGEWVNAQTHNERQTGFGAGFAALSLRDFSKSKMNNPYPPQNFWRALAKIANTPPQDAQPTHFLVLKSMVECGAERFIGFYGQAAVAALRKALVEFPVQAPKSVAASAVSVLPEVLERDLKVYI